MVYNILTVPVKPLRSARSFIGTGNFLPQDILQMLTWMADGYLHEKQRDGTPPQIDDLMVKYRTWTTILKKASYKEE